MPITYDNYEFETDPDPELEAVIREYEHIFNDVDPLPDAMGAWSLEKPVSVLEIMPPEKVQQDVMPSYSEVAECGTPVEIGAFLHEFEQWFYYLFDGYNLYFSRFEGLPKVVAGARSSAIHGILYGYPTEDIAQFLIDGEEHPNFKTESGWEY